MVGAQVRELGVKVLRVVNSKDMVPKVPSLIFNEDFTLFNNVLDFFPWTYSHVGEEIELDHDYSPFLQQRGNLLNNHNMEAYLHLLTGHHGRNIPWRQVCLYSLQKAEMVLPSCTLVLKSHFRIFKSSKILNL